MLLEIMVVPEAVRLEADRVEVVAIVEAFKGRKDWKILVAINCCVPAEVLFWGIVVGSIVGDIVFVVIVEFLGTVLGCVTAVSVVLVTELDDGRGDMVA